MRFLVDVNASGAVAQWLAGEEHDVVCVADRDPRMTDREILTWALRDRRIIVTTDQDFEEMVWREGQAHHGILRLENVPRAERRELLRDVLVRHRDALETGAIVIALSRKTRSVRLGDHSRYADPPTMSLLAVRGANLSKRCHTGKAARSRLLPHHLRNAVSPSTPPTTHQPLR